MKGVRLRKPQRTHLFTFINRTAGRHKLDRVFLCYSQLQQVRPVEVVENVLTSITPSPSRHNKTHSPCPQTNPLRTLPHPVYRAFCSKRTSSQRSFNVPLLPRKLSSELAAPISFRVIQPNSNLISCAASRFCVSTPFWSDKSVLAGDTVMTKWCSTFEKNRHGPDHWQIMTES